MIICNEYISRVGAEVGKNAADCSAESRRYYIIVYITARLYGVYKEKEKR